jgi:hypothetical protein
MIVPQYWAEARVQHREPGRQVTVRRFGWSDQSQDDAEAMAQERVQGALAQILAGVVLPRRERRVKYNGADGVPIREEIVARYGDTIITRNAYGARCLNTPNVLFADIDYFPGPSCGLSCSVFLVLMTIAIVVGWNTNFRLPFYIATGTALCLTAVIPTIIDNLITKAGGGPENIARTRIRKFIEQHIDWNVRVYRTPAGLRVLAMHQTFEPHDPAVADCFRDLQVDLIYVQMCQKQNCFRARVSGKPWRMGIDDRLRPRPGTWPVKPEYLPQREAWVDKYEEKAREYAACVFLESLGSGTIHPEARHVQELHDELCQVNSQLKLA